MSPLLRRIRRQLLKGRRFRKYSLYAAGEILLIVVGVLLALQLNNWNESRKKARVEDQLLEGFLRDLARDTVSLK